MDSSEARTVVGLVCRDHSSQSFSLSPSVSAPSPPQFSKPVLFLGEHVLPKLKEISFCVATFLELEHAFSDPFMLALNQLPGHRG
jgi:hypothetical protein